MRALADADLRRALPGRDSELTSLEHRDAIERLREGSQHTIRFRESRFDGSCMTYALGLDTQDTYRRVALAFEPPVFAGKEFADWLADHIEEQDAPSMGALVMYFEGDTWRHVGMIDDVDGPRVVSKWGEMAVFEHGLDEAPVGYGDNVRFFEKPDPKRALDLFLTYARAVTSEEEIADILR
ncbi:MAG: hypothetical protein K2P70_01820 [Hyphomonadaceae bacterium]|nr:hypothetical protein [Hyphomonadaceae bacterium]